MRHHYLGEAADQSLPRPRDGAGIVLAACSSSATTAPSAPVAAASAQPSAAASMAASAGASAVASPSAAAQLSGNITFLEKWPDPVYAPYFQQVVAAYEALHPNVKIDLQAVGDQPIKDKLQVLAASKQMPDIYFSWLATSPRSSCGAGSPPT